MAQVLFKRCPLYKETYLARVHRSESIKDKFRQFMETKRNNPHQPFGSSDKPFVGKGHLAGLKHAHITHDLSIVYKIEGNIVYLYGFFTHDDLGTGNPANMNRQKSASVKLSNQNFE